jgi:hypothetical protein
MVVIFRLPLILYIWTESLSHLFSTIYTHTEHSSEAWQFIYANVISLKQSTLIFARIQVGRDIKEESQTHLLSVRGSDNRPGSQRNEAFTALQTSNRGSAFESVRAVILLCGFVCVCVRVCMWMNILCHSRSPLQRGDGPLNDLQSTQKHHLWSWDVYLESDMFFWP